MASDVQALRQRRRELTPHRSDPTLVLVMTTDLNVPHRSPEAGSVFMRAQALADRLRAYARRPGEPGPSTGGEDLVAWRPTFDGDPEAEAAHAFDVLSALVDAYRVEGIELLTPPVPPARVSAWETEHGVELSPWFRRCLTEIGSGYDQRTETTYFDMSWKGFRPDREVGPVGRLLTRALEKLGHGDARVDIPADIDPTGIAPVDVDLDLPAAVVLVPLRAQDEGQNGVYRDALITTGPLRDRVVELDPIWVQQEPRYELEERELAMFEALGVHVRTEVRRGEHVVTWLVRFVREDVLGEDIW